MSRTDKRTDVIAYQYRPLQKLLLVLNCRDCHVFESNKYLLLLLMQNLASKILRIFVTGSAYAPYAPCLSTPLLYVENCMILASTVFEILAA